MTKALKIISIVALASLLSVAILNRPAIAGAIESPGAGGISSSLVCLLTGGTGCTMTGGTVYGNVATDITTGTNEDLTITPDGTGDVILAKSLMMRHGDAPQIQVGNAGNVFFQVHTGSAPQTRISAGSFGSDGGLDNAFIWIPRAKAITVTTDTATVPAHHLITVSSTGVSAWTVSETGAVSGECFKAVNNGANVITMTDSAGVYEGGTVACALGQWDAVSACYIIDRWVEVSCRDN